MMIHRVPGFITCSEPGYSIYGITEAYAFFSESNYYNSLTCATLTSGGESPTVLDVGFPDYHIFFMPRCFIP